MPQSIPHGLKREHVLQALADLASGAEHRFGPPTGYELVHEGKRFAPKAVVGLAFRHLTGRILRPDEFSGGEAPGQANHLLRQLGFTVVKKGEAVADDSDKQASKDWTGEECRLVVADYFDMLEHELLGKDYSKTDHRRALLPRLSGRSEGSVEFKHQNAGAQPREGRDARRCSTAEEDALLRELPAKEVAARTGRTLDAVYSRRYVLGLLKGRR